MHVTRLDFPRAAESQGPPPAPAYKGTEYQPAIDWWEAGGQRFESTRELLDSLQVPAEGVEATYRYLESPPPTEKMHPAVAAGAGAVIGAAVGAGGTALVTGFGNLVGELLYLLTLGFGGQPETVELSARALGIAAGVGAAVGGAGACIYNRTSGLPTTEDLAGSKIGTIRREPGEKTVFYVNNDLKSAVSLDDYAQATPPPPPEPVDPRQARKEGAVSAGLGMASAAVPLVGLVLPVMTMSGMGHAAFGTPGAVAGGALGAGATAATWTAAAHFGPEGWLGAAAASGLVGAAIGWAVGPSVAAGEAVVPGLDQQWWRKGSADQPTL